MLACADGSFLPLIAKVDDVSHAQVFELDATLCHDVELVVRRQPPPSAYTGQVATAESQVHGCGVPGDHAVEHPVFDYQVSKIPRP